MSIFLLLLRVIWVSPCHRLLGPVSSKCKHWILNVGHDLGACCAYEGETGTDDSLSQLISSQLPVFPQKMDRFLSVFEAMVNQLQQRCEEVS